MMKIATETKEGVPSVILGLSYKNLKGLRKVGPVVVKLSELGHKGTLILAYSPDGKKKVDAIGDSLVINLTNKALRDFKKGGYCHLTVDTSFYEGELEPCLSS